MVATVKVRITKNELPAYRNATPQKIDLAIHALALEGERYVKDSFGSAGSPSVEGGPPGIDTGTLKNSIHVESVGVGKRRLVDGVEYGIFLEFGTSKMGARPFMLPGVVHMKANVLTIFRGIF